ncbi:type I CRISPR-associated protein Cas7 [Salinispora arenicola]|uniref:type I CRISPR-associated protein Cas7 n=1 Tax=Salinispora arenicola TaxID=168697 RepID=UPI003F5CDE3A
MTAAHLDPTRRHDAVLLFDVSDGNPNGDPDAGNQPRTDDESGQGLVTDVAIKRKIRVTVSLLRGDDPRYGIFVEAGFALNTRIEAALKTNPGKADEAQRWMCEHYFDVRMFGVCSARAQGRRRRPGPWPAPAHLRPQHRPDPAHRPHHHPGHPNPPGGHRQGRAHGNRLQVDRPVRPISDARLLLRAPRHEDGMTSDDWPRCGRPPRSCSTTTGPPPGAR